MLVCYEKLPVSLAFYSIVWIRSIMRYLLLYLLTSISLFASVITGRVIAVTDGDTITVLDDSKTQHKIRLWGIDAPESRQDYGQRAKQALSDMVYNKAVTVDVQDTDRYKREVGKVYQGDTYVNLEMVKLGLAWWYQQYARNATDLRDAEATARAEKIGLWSRPDVIAPWDFRRGKRTASKGTEEVKRPEETKYWVTNSSGKVHNSSCRWYGKSKGRIETKPSGKDCKICGGTSK